MSEKPSQRSLITYWSAHNFKDWEESGVNALFSILKEEKITVGFIHQMQSSVVEPQISSF